MLIIYPFALEITRARENTISSFVRTRRKKFIALDFQRNFLMREASSDAYGTVSPCHNVRASFRSGVSRTRDWKEDRGSTHICTGTKAETGEGGDFSLAYPNVRGCRKHERLRITDTAALKLLLADEGWRISRGNSARTATTRRGCSFAMYLAPIDDTSR